MFRANFLGMRSQLAIVTFSSMRPFSMLEFPVQEASVWEESVLLRIKNLCQSQSYLRKATEYLYTVLLFVKLEVWSESHFYVLLLFSFLSWAICLYYLTDFIVLFDRGYCILSKWCLLHFCNVGAFPFSFISGSRGQLSTINCNRYLGVNFLKYFICIWNVSDSDH